MANPSEGRQRAPRQETWKKLWGTPVQLDDAATEAAFEELTDALVPSHMQARFTKRFGLPRERFGNRFFSDRAVFREWNTKLSLLGAEGSHVTVDVITGDGRNLSGYRLRGQTRRTLKDIFIDDAEALCAIARTPQMTLFILTEPGMKGGIVVAAGQEAAELE